MPARGEKLAVWLCRICFTVVFVVNVQCALQFTFDPAGYEASFQLSGVEGEVAVQGLGIAFLMWNATYPAFIVSPRRFKALGFVVLAQQIIGLVGESAIYLRFSASVEAYSQLSESILRFIQFDTFGLIIMAASLAIFVVLAKKRVSSS